MLDTEELFHLALHASSTGQHHACLGYLDQVLQREPRNARATYLLAVQHAEIGLFDRAISELREALSIEPGLEMARFQLGLLLVDRNRNGEAREYLSQLSRNTGDLTLRECAQAMLAFCDNNVTAAREHLTKAISGKSNNRALLALAQRLLASLAPTGNDETAEGGDGRVQLGAYARST